MKVTIDMESSSESDERDEEETLLLSLLYRRRSRRRRSRSVWVRAIFAKRQQQGEYSNLLQEMRLSDPQCHFQYLRMSKERFDILLSLVGPLLAKRHYFSGQRTEITPAERLAVTLRYLATGNSQVSLSFNFRIGRSTICGIVRETSQAIWDALNTLYVRAPSNQQEWKGISDQFESQWNFPNCVGAVDGKHIIVQAPSNSGSSFFNYKGTHSIVLMAVCDAYYRFILLDIGDTGRHSDGGVFSNSTFGKAVIEGTLPLPPDCSLPGTSQPDVPYVIVGDAAFPLKINLMRPYPGRNLPEPRAIFNYRLSRARRVIENSFGVLAARWRIFRRPIIAKPDNVVVYTKASIALHNFLRTTESSVYCPPGFIDSEDADGNVICGSWREEQGSSGGLSPVSQAGSNHHSRIAAMTRDNFCTYFNSTQGELSWQYHHVRRTH